MRDRRVNDATSHEVSGVNVFNFRQHYGPKTEKVLFIELGVYRTFIP